ncbi:MAG: SurA N-terminal domain-containing protein [Fulvivirga sp.]|uniref:SurA N-terminal domain-containing protein n=1 Tax=Fulvivirga sp. TaxID=1931237 RepID=UPI0032EF4D4A
MAVINTLRNKMGKFIVAAVAIAIMSFVLADLLGPNSSLMGGGNDVGEIAGETISLKEFQATVQERESSYILNFNRQPTDRERPTLRQQAWDLLINKYAFDKQYDEVGVQVTDDEIWDMLQGKNINPSLKQAFTNPETGEYDRSQFMTYLQQLPSLDANARMRWEVFKNELIQGRVRVKYENLLTKTNYVTSAEAQREYQGQNNVAEVKYLYIPYYTVSDSLISLDDDKMKAYYNKNKERYKVEASRSLKYVAFDIIPSAADTALVKEELLQLIDDFKKAESDSVFASLNSDDLTSFGNYNPGNLPVQLKANISNLSKGDVRGPYLDAEGFKLYKLTDIYEDTVGYAKASHILIKGEDDEAKYKAQDILNDIKNGADFAEMAKEHGTDGTASRGGDLGWFGTGKMVAEFEEAVFNASEKGLINKLVKTQFGYHIIEVTELKTNTAFKVATVAREVLPGDETINEAFTQADLFASSVDDLESFEAQAAQDSLQVLPANNLKANDRRVGTLGDARQIVQWVFSDASKGDISEVYELDEAYVVAVMTDEVEEGTKPFEMVKNEIGVIIRKEAKAIVIKDKLSGLSGTLDEKAAAYGDDANVYSSSALQLSATSLPSVGFDPKAVGAAFALESGETGAPIEGENGVIVFKMENKTIAPEIADYATYRDQVQQRINGQVSYGITEAIKEYADIQDERYKFY